MALFLYQEETMGPNKTDGNAKDDEVRRGKLNVRFEPAADAGRAAERSDARKRADELVAPALEEAGYGYGV
jgi:hypothetical protein